MVLVHVACNDGMTNSGPEFTAGVVDREVRERVAYPPERPPFCWELVLPALGLSTASSAVGFVSSTTHESPMVDWSFLLFGGMVDTVVL